MIISTPYQKVIYQNVEFQTTVLQGTVINSLSTLQTSNKLKVACSYSIWSIVCVDGIMIVDREAPSHRTWSYERSHDVYLRSHRSYVRSHYVYLRSHLVYHALIRYIYALI